MNPVQQLHQLKEYRDNPEIWQEWSAQERMEINGLLARNPMGNKGTKKTAMAPPIMKNMSGGKKMTGGGKKVKC